MAIEVSDFRALAKIITSETMKTVSAGKKNNHSTDSTKANDY